MSTSFIVFFGGAWQRWLWIWSVSVVCCLHGLSLSKLVVDPIVSLASIPWFFSFCHIVRPFWGLSAALTLVSPISIYEMLRDVCGWFYCVFLRDVPVPRHFVRHPSGLWTQNNMMLISNSSTSLSLLPIFGVFCYVVWYGCCLQPYQTT